MKKLLMTLVLAGFATSVSAGELTETCKKYFDEVDAFFKDMPAAQAEAMKKQYDASKQQFAALPSSVQDQTCNQALEQFEQVKKTMKK